MRRVAGQRRGQTVNRAALAVAVALAAAALAGPAVGQEERTAPTPRPDWLAGTPPAGWSERPGLARSVGTGLLQSAPFGDLGGRGGALAFVERGTGAFYLSWLESDRPAPAPVEAVRGALDRLRESRLVSGPDARSTEELRYDEGMQENLAEARLDWRHLSNETLSLVRA